ncbi:ABC transporter permease [Streptosporangium sp. NPDC051022]|uniref:ABC transporter permease n=1 Tax=Streptosporangium sp. NPDC051022 TaxID=3155752 RepID=UPI003416E5B8
MTTSSSAASAVRSRRGSARAVRRMHPGYLLVIPAAVLVGVFFAYPVISLALDSVLKPTPGTGHYADIFTDPTSMRILVRTFTVALLVTAVTLVLAYPYAYLMTLVGPRTRTVLMFLVLLPFWSSLMARTFAWVVLLQPGGVVSRALGWIGLEDTSLLGTQLGVTIAMAQVLLPFMVLPLYSNMSGIDRRLLDAAHSMGASRATAFRKVYLPLSIPGVTAGSVLVFILCLGFWVTPRLVGSPQESLIGQLIATKVEKLLDFPSAGALSVILLVVTMLLLLVVQGMLRRLAGRLPGAGGTDDE